MRCECCDKELTPAEDSAVFVEHGQKTNRRVGMCTECRSYLDPSTKFATKKTLDKVPEPREPEVADPFDLQSYDEDDERW